MKREQARNSVPAQELPRLIELGAFAAEQENEFAISVTVDREMQVQTEIDDAEISPTLLPAGAGSLRLKLPPMRAGVLLHGALIFGGGQGGHRLYVTGRAAADAPVRTGAPIGLLPALVRGERLSVGADDVLTFLYEDAGRAAGIEVDAYVFRLYENGRVRGDEDLVFFGNRAAEDGSLRVEEGTRIGAVIDVACLAADAARIVVCFSVYDDGTGRDFSETRSPVVTLCEGDAPQYRFPLDVLHREKTVVAAELYRYRGAWKLRLVGAGYEAGLARLCEEYGLNVE